MSWSTPVDVTLDGLERRCTLGSMRLSDLPEYHVWRDMRQRCYNPNHKNYHHYGGRGIKVCARWMDSFWAFIQNMGRRPHPKLTIERINNNGDYEVGNCRWDTRSAQNRNKRHRITPEMIQEVRALGKIASQSAIAFDLGISVAMVCLILNNKIRKDDSEPSPYVPLPSLRVEDIGTAVLTAKKVAWIKYRLGQGDTLQSLADEYGVSPEHNLTH